MNFLEAQAKILEEREAKRNIEVEKLKKELMASQVASEMRKKEMDRLGVALEEAKTANLKKKKKYTFDPPAYHDIKPILNDTFTIMESICGMNK